MAANRELLEQLHDKITRQFTATLDRDLQDDLPTDAATLSVIKGFLKDNEITCDPAEAGVTDALQQKFRAQAEIREARKKQALALVQAKQQQDTEQKYG